MFQYTDKIVENQKIKLLRYNYSNALSPRHWLQFAGETALAEANQEESQALLNVFTKWYQSRNLKICINKCRCFGIKKNGNQSNQFTPYLKVNNEIIPAFNLNDLFVYLAREFCYNMSSENVKCDLVKRLSNYLENRHSFFTSKTKKNILAKFLYSKVKWDLTIYHFPKTWIVQNLYNKENRYICKWLSIPISGNVNHLCQLPNDICRFNPITAQNILKSSKNKNMR